MKKADMQEALRTGFNKQGRHVSESMRIKYVTALANQEKPFEKAEYRGFEVSGGDGRWFVSTFPVVFPSRVQAIAAVDRCWNLREELASE